MSVPTIKLNNGVKMPVIGLGTMHVPAGIAPQVIVEAIDIGYRFFDCAFAYSNEAEIGKGLNIKLQDGTVKRNELFICSKVWNTHHSFYKAIKMCQTSLTSLNLHYIDLYLIHWPMGFKEGTQSLMPVENKKVLYSDVDYLETWEAMEQLVKLGMVKSIGVSNFNIAQLERILEHCKIKPTTNQIECNPYNTQTELVDWCKKHNIVVIAYCPLERAHNCPNPRQYIPLINNSVLGSLENKYRKTPAQIILRFLIQMGTVPIPKTINKHRLEEDIHVFNFELTKADMERISALNGNRQHYMFLETKDHPYYPFKQLC